MAGAFLMLATVFNASAQSAITLEPLYLGEPVTKLKLGANEFYHLVVTDISDGSGPIVFDPNSNPATLTNIKPLVDGDDLPQVLYMGDYSYYFTDPANSGYPVPYKNGTLPIFVESLGNAGQSTGLFNLATQLGGAAGDWSGGAKWFEANAAKSKESASSLWCTVVYDYDQGQNITFDFTNKYVKDQLLEVDVNGYDIYENGWSDLFGDGYQTSWYNNLVPGTVSGWNFSQIYKTAVEVNKPLFSYITPDTVAVLCADINNATDGTDIDVVLVKIASVDDVLAGIVPGMLYFTLYEPAPFALDAKDFNTMLGDQSTPAARKLKFSPNVNGNGITNPFTGGDGLFAQELVDAAAPTISTGFGIKEWNSATVTGTTPLVGAYYNQTSLSPVDFALAHTPTPFTNTTDELDKLGYLYLRDGGATGDFLFVDHEYYDDNVGGDQFLKFGFRENLIDPTTPDPTLLDTVLYTQSVWRLIYYPSNDSIYINPYQATYLPTWNSKLMVRGDVGSDIVNTDQLSQLHPVGSAITWTDSIAQSDSFYTFRATPANMDKLAQPAWNGGYYPAPYLDMVGRLKYGKQSNVSLYREPDFFSYYHHNYVTIQNLTSTVRIVTLGNGNIEGNHKIDTHINFGNYSPCQEQGASGRTTVPQDLYLIRNELGQYLHVPLYSATDSAEWVYLEPSVHPELLPSFQWIVLQRYAASSASSIEIINREFDGLRFGYIQLDNGANNDNKPMPKFNMLSGKDFSWNNKAVNDNWVLFSKDDGKSTFVRLDAVYKKDKFMGYTYLDSLTTLLNTYSLNFGSGIDPNYYMSWEGDWRKYPNTDTTVYVYGNSDFDKLYFKFDSVQGYPLSKYGWQATNVKTNRNYIADLVTLERQPYQMNFEDPYKFICGNLFSMINGDQAEYAMGNYSGNTPRGSVKDMIGQPMFNLRHFYHVNGEPYFALVQRIDTLSAFNITNPSSSAPYTDERNEFINYLTSQYGSAAANIVIGIIDGGITDVVSTNNNYFKTGVFVAQFDDQTSKLKAQLRADNVTRVSTFRLQKDDDPIYRRFNVADLDADEANDDPKVLKFFSIDNNNYELFENSGEKNSQKPYWDYSAWLGTIKPLGKKNYLGYVNINQHPDAATAIYVDTAYINRPGGDVKPQYMLVVDPMQAGDIEVCDEFGNPIPVTEQYLRGRYLINATDSARGVGSSAAWNTVVTSTNPVYDGKNYLWDTNWERLVFTDAIHVYKKDALYFANWPGVSLDDYTLSTGILDTAAIDKASAEVGKATTAALPIRKVFLGNNLHKDVVFSMRLMFRGNREEFLIESESGAMKEDVDKIGAGNPTGDVDQRIWGVSYGGKNSNGPVWAPCQGGWVKIQNQVPVISRSDDVYESPQGMGYNTRRTQDLPTANDNVIATAITVLGGDDAVTILNAAGKKVVISNILGQTVASTVLSSDNASIAAPAGVVVVAIEGETPVKALVK
ncbi:MAG: DUF6383 domain-containing protein [Tannerella sp.]|nr:DUF6383 domain-containing protein [Tannerella sp.]